jgi:SOS-response transcriptional repressor LexA
VPGAWLLLDRHYTSLNPYRKNDGTMYAVRKKDSCVVRYVQAEGENLILRPHNPAYPVEIVPLETEQIVGRVCYVGMET